MNVSFALDIRWLPVVTINWIYNCVVSPPWRPEDEEIVKVKP